MIIVVIGVRCCVGVVCVVVVVDDVVGGYSIVDVGLVTATIVILH